MTDRPEEDRMMRDHFKTGAALLAAVLLAVPLSAGAQSKMDKAQERSRRPRRT